MNNTLIETKWKSGLGDFVVSQIIKCFVIVFILGFFSQQATVFASEIKTSVTNDFHFFKDGSGCMSITVSGSDIYSIAKVFGLSKKYLSDNSLNFHLKEALDKLGLKEQSKALTTNGAIVTFTYVCKFSSPKAVLDWLDDNVSISGKYIKWQKNYVELQIRLGEEYDANTSFVFRFDGYNIKNANGIMLDAKAILWRPDESNGIKTLHLRAES
jgi:hypothetical protein